MIINEMAGSGGDLMPYMFQRRKIGPLVGKRTWGGLVHTADTPTFIDGGSMIAPRGGFFTRDGKWAVENEGVAPDIDVENWPKDVIAGHDPQLERAVEEAMRLLKEKPVERHDDGAAAADVGQAQGRQLASGQFRVDASAFAFDLVGCDAEVLQNRHGKSQGDLTFSREGEVRPGKPHRPGLAQVVRPHHHTNVGIELARQADRLFDVRHPGNADDDGARVSGPGGNQRVGTAAVAVDRVDPLALQAANGRQVHLQHRHLEAALAQQAGDRASDRSMADNHCPLP